MSNESNSSEKKTREKSALYPAVSISECLEFINQIDKLGGKSFSYASILEILGLTSPTTKSFLNRISASKQFGFITTGSSTVQFTDLAKRIMYPSNGEKESKKLLIEAFANPPLYAKLIDRFRDKAVPPKVQLSNILFNEYRIIKPVKDNAADCFIESASYLGLMSNGVLCFESGKNKEETETDSFDREGTSSLSEERIHGLENVMKEQESEYKFEIPTLGKKTARFYIPGGVTAKDIDYLNLYIQKMLPTFLDNLKSEIKQE